MKSIYVTIKALMRLLCLPHKDTGSQGSGPEGPAPPNPGPSGPGPSGPGPFGPSSMHNNKKDDERDG